MIKKKKSNKKPAEVIDTTQVKRIRSYIREKTVSEKYKRKKDSEYKKKRDVMLLDIAVTTGYRLQDLVDLKIEDLRYFLGERSFIITEKKKINALMAKLEGKKVEEDEEHEDVFLSADEIIEKKVNPREVEIIPELEELIEEYIEGKRGYEYAFHTTKCKKEEKEEGTAPYIERESYSKEIGVIGKKLFKIKGISGHSLRKAYARNIYDRTKGDIVMVKELLGHSSIEVTKRYLGLNKVRKREAQGGLKSFLT